MAAPMEVLLTAEASGQLWNTCVWEPRTGVTLATYKGSSSAIQTLQLLGQDFLISAINNKPLIRVWSCHQKDQTQMRMVCPGRVTALTVSPDGNYCVASVLEKIHVWQVCTGNLYAVLSNHYQNVTCLRFTDDGSHFVSGAEDNMVLVWSLARVLSEDPTSKYQGQVTPRHMWTKHSLPITDIHLGRGGVQCRVFSASLDHTVKMWELSSGQLLCSCVFDCGISSLVVDPAEQRLFAGASSGAIYQVNLFHEPVRVERHIDNQDSDGSYLLIGHTKRLTCLDISLDGSLLVSGSTDTNVHLWDTGSRQMIRTLPHKGPITNLLMVVPPAKMLAKDNMGLSAAPPVQTFKRYLHNSQAMREEVADARQTLPVRLNRPLHPADSDVTEDDRERTVWELMEQQKQYEKVVATTTMGEGEMAEKVSQLEKVNRTMYDFAVKRLLGAPSDDLT